MGSMSHQSSGECSLAPQKQVMGGSTKQHWHLVPQLGSRLADVASCLPEQEVKGTWERWQDGAAWGRQEEQKPSSLFGGSNSLGSSRHCGK